MNLFQIASIRANRDGEEMDLRDLDIVDDYVRELFKIENKTLRERVLFKDLLLLGIQRALSYANSYCDGVDDEELDKVIMKEGTEEDAEPAPDDEVETPEGGTITYSELLERMESDTSFSKLWHDTYWDEFLIESGETPYKSVYAKRRAAVLDGMTPEARQHFAMAETIERVLLELRETLKGYGYAVKRSELEKQVYAASTRTWRRCVLPGEPWAFCTIEEWLTRTDEKAIIDPPQGLWDDRQFAKPLEEVAAKRAKHRETRGWKRELPQIPYTIATEIWKRLKADGLLDGTARDFGRLFDHGFEEKHKDEFKEPPRRCTFKSTDADLARLCRRLTDIANKASERREPFKLSYAAFEAVFTNDLRKNLSAHNDRSKDKKTTCDAVMDGIVKDIENGKLK